MHDQNQIKNVDIGLEWCVLTCWRSGMG